MSNLKIPRPLGTTMLLQSLKGDIEGVNRDRLNQKVIQQWLSNSYQLNNRNYSIQELCTYLQCEKWKVLREMGRYYSLSMGFQLEDLDDEELNRLARVSLLSGVGLATEGLIQAQQQLNLLLTAQGGKYKPFITAEVMSAMKNIFEGNKMRQSALNDFLRFEQQAKTRTLNPKVIAQKAQNELPQSAEEVDAEYITRDDLLKQIALTFKADQPQLGQLNEEEDSIEIESINGRFIKGPGDGDFRGKIKELKEAGQKRAHHTERESREILHDIEGEVEKLDITDLQG